jgi:hypothetical protein
MKKGGTLVGAKEEFLTVKARKSSNRNKYFISSDITIFAIIYFPSASC